MMMMIVVFVLFAQSASASTAATSSLVVSPSFKFQDFIVGEWRVYTSEGDAGLGVNIETNKALVMNISAGVADGDSIILVGQSFMNDSDTGVISQRGNIQIEISSKDPNTGVFMAAKENESLHPIYEFSFDPVISGVAMSTGKFTAAAGRDPSTYTFQVNSWDSFTFVSIPAEGPITIYFGHRHKIPVEKSFLAKYGSTAMLLAVFMFNMMMQKKMRKVPEPEATEKETTEARVKTE